jgi:hypothetical protein
LDLRAGHRELLGVFCRWAAGARCPWRETSKGVSHREDRLLRRRQAMLDPISFLTPHKVTLAILVRLSVQHDDDDDSEMERQAWLELALYLVEEVRSSAQYFEKSLDDVLLDLAGMDPTVLSQSLTDELDKMDSPDALFSFLQVSLKEVSGDDAVRVERNSVFDVFIRKVLLSFNSMPFERFAALYTDLAAYNQAAKDVGMERDDEEEGQEERPPPLSVDDLQAHVHREARLLEVSTEPLELEHLETDIAAMMCVPLSRARAALPSAALAGPFEPAQVPLVCVLAGGWPRRCPRCCTCAFCGRCTAAISPRLWTICIGTSTCSPRAASTCSTRCSTSRRSTCISATSRRRCTPSTRRCG